jgi:selenocysteine-specific elongation factor
VKALTGTDPDRLKEEKERGITIDLGFADLAYPDGLKVGIVDVPGHERLIKNMLAGAGGIDIVLMVIAADEGTMPQSREHLDICNLLKVKRGLIVINKSDLVEKDWLTLIEDDIRKFVKDTFLENAEMIAVSSKTGHNIELLKEKIHELALSVETKSVHGIFRLPVDRIFTLKGFGTVVTGTAVAGSISLDDPVEILPKGIKTKIRGLQSHGETLKKAYAGQRVAINLQGLSKDEIQRGDVITMPDKIKTTLVIDAELEMLKDSSIDVLKSRSLVHFHTGTSELIARIVIYPVRNNDELKPGDRAYCQFRFKTPVAVMAGDRYIIRKFSPLLTIEGRILTLLRYAKKNRKNCRTWRYLGWEP